VLFFIQNLQTILQDNQDWGMLIFNVLAECFISY